MGTAYYKTQTNNTYQTWDSYPETPDLPSDYPYQAIAKNSSQNLIFLCLSKNEPLVWDGINLGAKASSRHKMYSFNAGVWALYNEYDSQFLFLADSSGVTIFEANHDIYSDVTYATVTFTKTTDALQDPGNHIVWRRVRGVRIK